MNANERLACLIEDWFNVYEILRCFNTPDRLLMIITEIEHAEFTREYDGHARVEGADAPSILDELADLGIFGLQTLRQLDVPLLPILNNVKYSEAGTIVQAVDAIQSARDQLHNLKNQQEATVKNIQEAITFLLSSVATYCTLIGLSWVDISYEKLSYCKDAMPAAVWQMNEYPEAETIEQAFKQARPRSKKYQQENFPKEEYLFVTFAQLPRSTMRM